VDRREIDGGIRCQMRLSVGGLVWAPLDCRWRRDGMYILENKW